MRGLRAEPTFIVEPPVKADLGNALHEILINKTCVSELSR